MPAGSGGQIALFSVGSLYADVNSALLSGAQWTDFVSESIEHNLTELQEGSITGYKGKPPSHKGVDSGQGDINLEPNPNALGMFMRGVFGQSSGSVITAGTAWGANSGSAQNNPPGYTGGRPVVRHIFVPRQTPFDDRTFLPPHGLMLYKDVGSAFIHMGAIFPSVEVQVQAGQLTKATVSMMSRNVTRHARPAGVAALRNPGGRPWTWDQTSIQVGPNDGALVAFDKYQSLSIKYETPIEGVLLLDGTKKFGEFQTNGFQSVDINGTMTFRDQLEYDAFVNYEEQFLRVAVTNTSSSMVLGDPASASFYQLGFDIPAMKYLSWSAPIQGPNRITATFKAKGEFDTTSLYQISAWLINTTSAYV